MTNFVTCFKIECAETSKMKSLAITEIVSMDFIHEYIEAIKKATELVDSRSAFSGRWNWEYFATKMIAQLGDRYSRQRLIPHSSIEDISWIKNMKYGSIYKIHIETISDIFANSKALGIDALRIKIEKEGENSILYDLSLIHI